MRKYKVLIIDDDPSLSEMYKIKFEKEGFEVLIESDGLSGISTAVKTKPDIILLDIMMPQVDGFETLRAFRRNTSLDLIILIISNLSKKSGINKALEGGADDYLIKADHTPGEIIQKVKDLIRNKNLKKDI